MVLMDDQQPVEDLAAKGTDDPFADGVRSGCLRRAGKNPDALRREDGVERVSELAGAVPDQELNWSRALAEVHQEVAGRLCSPRAVGVGSDSGEVNATGAVLDDDQGVDAPQEYSVHADEVGREDAVGCGAVPRSRAGAPGVRHPWTP